MNINRLKILTRRDLMFISESKLQDLINRGYTIEGECGSCNQSNNQNRQYLGYNSNNYNQGRIASLAPTCPNSAPYYNKKYYGIQYTANTVGPGLIKLESIPTSATPGETFVVSFYKDGTTPLTPVLTPVPGTFQYWYVPQLTDVTTGTPIGSHAFNTTVQGSCVGSQLVTETPCTMVIVDLGSVTANGLNPLNVTLGVGQNANVNLSFLDTVGTAYPTTFTGSVTQLLAQTATMSGTLANYISLTGWNVGLIAPGSVTISLLSGAPTGGTGSVTLPVRVGTTGTIKSVTINVTTCSTPVCNFQVT